MTAKKRTPMPEADAQSEHALQQRWAGGAWPAPLLHDANGRPLRIIHAGQWNFGPGPDFRDAQLLDADGRVRRGDIECHLRPSGWNQHGHQHDPAYANVILHLVAKNSPGAAALSPALATIELPNGDPAMPAIPPPCANLRERAGSAALEAQLLQLAQRRFLRKATEITQLQPPNGPGSLDDRRAAIAAARALGQPHNAEAIRRALLRSLPSADHWDELASPLESALVESPWRHARGPLGAARTAAQILAELLTRWRETDGGPAAAFERLAQLPPNEAGAQLRIPHRLGTARARQLLADAIYPFSYAFEPWSQLPPACYQRTDALRDRLEPETEHAESTFNWRHPHTQALLELERHRCRHGACAACPLARLSRSSRAATASGGLTPSLNR